jgi:tRNA uridine 5-carboxymethylaminomethyl modification enzyme
MNEEFIHMSQHCLKEYAMDIIVSNCPLKIFLKRPQINLYHLKSLDHLNLDIPEFVMKQIEIEIKYAGFIQRQFCEVEKFKKF